MYTFTYNPLRHHNVSILINININANVNINIGYNILSVAKFRVNFYLLLQEEKMRMVVVTRCTKTIFFKDEVQLSIFLFPFSIQKRKHTRATTETQICLL
jgi:hypothetical protein